MNRPERKVKIVCTMGPACWEYERLYAMAEAGMNVARFNFSHGDYASHGMALERVRAVERERRLPIAALLDTKGPEIRTGLLKGHQNVTLKAGDTFVLRFDESAGDASGVSIDYRPLYKEITEGQHIFIDDGSIHLCAESVSPDGIICRVIVGGELGERKGVNVPGASLSVPTLTEKDVSDVRWGIEHGVDYIAVSFVRTMDDVMKVRRVIEENHGRAKIIAKMETRQSVDGMDGILSVADGVMVARGDLGVEIPTEDVPMVQKEIIEKCRSLGKPVIVATQMLDSMIRNPRPTRAEASDVANAVIDGADAVMLSGETAGGKYPLESVQTMNKIVMRTERELAVWQRMPKTFSADRDIADAVSHAAKEVAEAVGAKAIVSLTTSGGTARMVSKYRPMCPVIAVTPSLNTWRELSLVWGVLPIMSPFTADLEAFVETAMAMIQKEGLVDAGQNIVLTTGVPVGEPGSTNTVQVHTVGQVLSKGLSLVRKKVTGPARKAASAQEAIRKTASGGVLVIKESSKEYIPAIEKADAVVTEEDGLAGYAGIIALNLGIPCIAGASGVYDMVEDGMILTVDGKRGIVYLERSI